MEDQASVTSKYSNGTQQVHKLAERQAQQKLQQIADKAMSQEGQAKTDSLGVARTLGLYIFRHLVQNVAVQVPGLGIFSAVQNYINNEPVFFLQKDFLKGVDISSGVFTEQGQIRALANTAQQGMMRLKKLNYIELVQMMRNTMKDSGVTYSDKDVVKNEVDKLVRAIQNQYIDKQNVYFELPSVGVLIIKGHKSCVRFSPHLIRLLSKNKEHLKDSVKNGFSRPSKSIDYNAIKANQSLMFTKEALLQQDQHMSQSNMPTIFHKRTHQHSQLLAGQDPEVEEYLNNMLCTSYQTMAPTRRQYVSTAVQAKQSATLSTGQAKIQHWMTTHQLFSLEAFKQLLKHSGQDPQRVQQHLNSVHLNYQQFENCIRTEVPCLNKVEVELLWQHIDKQQTGHVTSRLWQAAVSDDHLHMNNLLAPFLDVITHYGYNQEQTMKVMNINNNQSPFDLSKVVASLRKLYNGLTEEKYNKLARLILQSEQYVEPEVLMGRLGEQFKAVHQKQKKDDAQFIASIRKNPKNQALLEELFGHYDSKRVGKLESNFFEDALVKAGLNEDKQYIKQFVNRLDKNHLNMIDYHQFLVTTNSDTKQAGLRLLAQQLKTHMETNKYKLPDLLYQIARKEECTLQQFGEYLQKYCGSTTMDIIQAVDVDSDGLIDYHDLSTFLSRHQYLHANSQVFPRRQWEPKQVDSLLTQLRDAAAAKRIKLSELFVKFDKNQDGFLDVVECTEGLAQLVGCSLPMRESFFCYLDNLKIGLVDQPRFDYVVLKKIPGIPLSALEDNFDWQQKVLIQLTKFIQEKGLKCDDLFRMLDTDFNEEISVAELKTFLTNKLHVRQDQLTIPQLERLYKLMDLNKYANINRQEFQRVYQELVQPEKQFDWKKSAIQQIGIHCVKHFTSIENSFDAISGHKDIVRFQQFNEYLTKHQILAGFNMTDRLMQQLFAELDTHRKGLLSQNDWVHLFKPFNKSGLIYQKFVDTIKYNFKSFDQFFKYFLDNNQAETPVIKFLYFYNAISTLLPKRFSKAEVRSLYDQIAQGQPMDRAMMHTKFGELFPEAASSTLRDQRSSSLNLFYRSNPKNCVENTSFNRYERINNPERKQFQQENPIQSTSTQFYLSGQPGPLNCQKSQTVYRVTNNTTNKLKNMAATSQTISSEASVSSSIIQKVRSILKGDEDTFLSKFVMQDINNTGYVNTLQFKKTLRYLGLNSKDIDLIFLIVEQRSGSINYKEFCRRVLNKKQEGTINKRPRATLEKLKTDIIHYVISIKDAFKRFNTDNSGLLKLEEFTNLINYIQKKNGEAALSFSRIKELFDYIDCRQDGVVDIHEWMQTFKKVKYDQQKDTPENVARFENDQKNENVVYLIAKSRRQLQKAFDSKKQGENSLVSIDEAVRILGDLFNKYSIGVDNQYIQQTLKFAIDKRVRDSIDYRFFLEVFKERQAQLKCVHV